MILTYELVIHKRQFKHLRRQKKLNKRSKEDIHTISSQPSGGRPPMKSIHQVAMKSVSMETIGTSLAGKEDRIVWNCLNCYFTHWYDLRYYDSSTLRRQWQKIWVFFVIHCHHGMAFAANCDNNVNRKKWVPWPQAVLFTFRRQRQITTTVCAGSRISQRGAPTPNEEILTQREGARVPRAPHRSANDSVNEPSNVSCFICGERVWDSTFRKPESFFTAQQNKAQQFPIKL